MKRILVVDGDTDVRARIAKHARMEGYDVTEAGDGETALSLSRQQNAFDLMVLAVNLPGMDGFTVLKAVRTFSAIPVLILSSKNTAEDRIHGLDLGADDYLTKPFALEELEARVRTLLRREFRQRESLVQVGALTLNTVTREVSGRGEPLPLTPREFAILEHLMLHRGCWISQEELMEHIWEADANPFSNAVRMHISSLRKKLRKRLGHDPIQTKVGRGYRLAGEETA